MQKNNIAGEYPFVNLAKETDIDNTKETLKDQEIIENRINLGEISETSETEKS